MAIKTNMKSLTPRRQAFKREIQLLSHGYTNPTAWPDGKIVVLPWDSTVDEFMLETQKRTKRDEVLFALIEKVCDLNGGSIDDLVVTELMIILLTARTMAVGQGRVHYKSTCPMCKTIAEEAITVPDDLERVGEKSPNYPGFDTITLPECQDQIKVRPLVVRDERIVLERPAEQRKAISDRRLRILLSIVSINDSRADTLEEMVRYHEALSPADVRFLEQQQDQLSPQLNTNIPHQCDACGHTYKHVLGFDTEFFR